MKFAWLSDTHIGFQQYGYERRRNDFGRAVVNAVQDILAKGIKTIVHTGDLLHANRPGSDSIACIKYVHELLIENQARMLVIDGNHDKTEPPWPDVLAKHHFGMSCRNNQILTIENVSFECVPFMASAQFKAREFSKGNVLLWHGRVQEFIGFPDPTALTLDELPTGKYQMILLGDIHVNDIRDHKGCVVGYPGSTEFYRETEDPIKYWVEVSIDSPTAKPYLTNHVIKTRRVMKVRINDPREIEQEITRIRSDVIATEREPIVFVEYPATIPNVVEQFRAAFNPDTYILQWRPYFVRHSDAPPVPTDKDQDALTPVDLLNQRLATRPNIAEIATILVNPEIDADAALSTYVDGRLRSLAQPA